MKITYVKKVLADGKPCKKCNEVQAKMEANDHMRFIDEILVADEADPNSVGMKLASRYDVSRAPFFIVENDGEVQIYSIYFKLVKEVLNELAIAHE